MTVNSNLANVFRQLIEDEQAASLPEYGILMFFLTVSIVGAVNSLIATMDTLTDFIGTSLEGVLD